jgi:hypothetical protein
MMIIANPRISPKKGMPFQKYAKWHNNPNRHTIGYSHSNLPGQNSLGIFKVISPNAIPRIMEPASCPPELPPRPATTGIKKPG